MNSCFTANNWLDFRKTAFARGSNMLMLDKVTPIGKVQLLANAGIKRLSVITAVVINPVPIGFEIVAKRFIF